MIRRENRHAIDGACLDVQRQQDVRHLPDEHSGRSYPIENISRGGLRFYSHDPYRVDERIQITLRMTDGKSHSAMARICYRHGNDDSADCCCYGVSFLDHFLEMTSWLRDNHN